MSVNVKDGSRGRRGYAPGKVDFFAIYIIPTDDWYIIPYAVVGDRDANLFFRPGLKGQKYSEYREAWHLLLDASKGRTEGPLEIQACREEDDSSDDCKTSEEINRQARHGSTQHVSMVREMVREMFRTLFWA